VLQEKVPTPPPKAQQIKITKRLSKARIKRMQNRFKVFGLSSAFAA